MVPTSQSTPEKCSLRLLVDLHMLRCLRFLLSFPWKRAKVVESAHEYVWDQLERDIIRDWGPVLCTVLEVLPVLVFTAIHGIADLCSLLLHQERWLKEWLRRDEPILYTNSIYGFSYHSSCLQIAFDKPWALAHPNRAKLTDRPIENCLEQAVRRHRLFRAEKRPLRWWLDLNRTCKSKIWADFK